MAIVNFPAWANTPLKRRAWHDRALELVRKLHNIMGQWHTVGIAQAKYNKLPAKVRNHYPFVLGETLTDTQWKDFLDGWSWSHNKQNKALSKIRVVLEDQLQADSTVIVNLESEIVE